jgi:hypothetical protein
LFLYGTINQPSDVGYIFWAQSSAAGPAEGTLARVLSAAMWARQFRHGKSLIYREYGTQRTSHLLG